MSFQCYYCTREFQSQISKRQHIVALHSSNNILLDENVHNIDSPLLHELIELGFTIIQFPDHMRGNSDSRVINYAKQKGYGLITYDKWCAYNATYFISPVFLIVTENFQKQVIKIN